MPELKWSVPSLEIRLQDPDPVIRTWAARWLRDYHGEAGQNALRRYVEAHRSVQAAAGGAPLSTEGPTPARLAPAEGTVLPHVGQELPHAREEADLRAFLAQALADPRNALTPDILAACPPVSMLPRVLASVRRGVDATGDWEEFAEQVLLVAGAGLDHLRLVEVALDRRPAEAAIAEAGPLPESLAGLVKTFLAEKKGTVEGLAAQLAPLWPAGGEDEMPRRTAPAVVRVRGQLAWRISACRAFAEEIGAWPFPADRSDSGPILVLALALAATRGRALLDRVRDGATPDEALSVVEAGYAWLDDAAFSWVAEVWGAARRGDLAQRALARIEAGVEPIARSNLLRLIGETKDEGVLGPLVDHLAKRGVEGVERAAIAALSPHGARALAALRGRLASAPWHLSIVAVQLAIDSPGAESEEFLTDEWGAIAGRLPTSAPLCMAAELFASPRFLGGLLDLWRPGEERVESAIGFLARWTKELAPPVRRIAEIDRGRAEQEARRRAPRPGDAASLEEVVHEFHRVPLACAKCGAVYRYDIGYCFMKPVAGPTPKDLRLEFRGFQHVVQCKRCLARDEFGVTEEGEFLLRCRQQLAVALIEKGVKADDVFERSLCVLDAPRSSDGTEFPSLPDAIRIQLGRVHAAPNDANAWARLGNLYHHGGLFADAREAYEAAVRIEPKDAEAQFGLAVIDDEEVRPARAAERLRAVLRLLAERRLPPEPGLACFDHCLRRLLAIEKEHGVPFRWELGGEPGDLASAAVRQRLYFKLLGLTPPTRRTEPPARSAGTPAPQRVEGRPTVGRNDPCPCGSGKKYKKCCLKE